MKKLLCVVVMLCGLSAVADDQGYLTGTNTIELAEGESLIVLCNLRSGATSHGVVVKFPPYDTPESKIYSYTVYQYSDLAHRTILGPCRVNASNSTHDIFGYKINRAEVFTNPMNVITLPAENTGDVNLVIESSPDLESWTAVYSGSAGTSGDAAFFRTRLIQN